MHKEKIVITSNDVDENLELRLSNLFKFLQQVASTDADQRHLGHWDLIHHNMAWVVMRMDVHIFQMPKLDEEITISTHPGMTRSFVYPRYYQVYDKEGKLIINISSIWTIIDRTTRRVVLKSGELPVIAPGSDEHDLPLPEKIVDDANDLVDTRRVRYSEIDLNGHLNNTEYIEFIVDTHEPNFYKEHSVSLLRINYDKEIRGDDVVDLYTNHKNPEVIKGMVNGFKHFTAELTYVKRSHK